MIGNVKRTGPAIFKIFDDEKSASNASNSANRVAEALPKHDEPPTTSQQASDTNSQCCIPMTSKQELHFESQVVLFKCALTSSIDRLYLEPDTKLGKAEQLSENHPIKKEKSTTNNTENSAMTSQTDLNASQDTQLPGKSKKGSFSKIKAYLRNDKSKLKCEWKPVAEWEKENDVKSVLTTIDHSIAEIMTNLKDFIAIRSIATQPDCSNAMQHIIEVTKQYLQSLQFTLKDIKSHNAPTDNVIFASYGCSPKKSTVLIYGYLDVFPAHWSDGWLSDPFSMTTSNGLLFGRGLSAGKGPLLCWLHAIDAWQQTNDGLPVNVKFLIEAKHECTSQGLEELVRSENDFFTDVDVILMFVNSWLGGDLPVLHCSLSGCIHFAAEVKSADFDLDPATAGDMVYEAMTDLCHLMNSLVDKSGAILIPNMQSDVAPLTADECTLLEATDFRVSEYKKQLQVRKMPHETAKVNVLERRWCKPTLTLHGIEGAYGGSGWRSLIPGKVSGRFSIKLVPKQNVEVITSTVINYLNAEFQSMNSKNQLTVIVLNSRNPYTMDTQATCMKAAIRAVTSTHGIEPFLTTGICPHLPVASMLAELTKKDIVLLPFASFNARNRESNESIAEKLFIRNTKLAAALLYEISCIPAASVSS